LLKAVNFYLLFLLPSTRVNKSYSTPIWSRVLALLGTTHECISANEDSAFLLIR